MTRGQQRDLTAAQFRAACERRGIRPVGFMGYFEVGPPGGRVSVSVLNTGSKRRRAWLAYLLEEHDQAEARAEAARATR